MDIGAVAHAGGLRPVVQNIRLLTNDPQGISWVVISPSLTYLKNSLVNRFGRTLYPIRKIFAIIAYALIVSALATVLADPVIEDTHRVAVGPVPHRRTPGLRRGSGRLRRARWIGGLA